MDILKRFLDEVCEDSIYTYEKVENLAEIYSGEIAPLALIEWNTSLGHFIIKFRIGLSSFQIAKLTNDMSVVDNSLIFDEDFIIDPDYGYLYGEDATKAFIERIQGNFQEAQYEDAMEGAIYVSSQPIFAAGSEFQGKTKLEKLWDLYDEDSL